VVTQKTRRKFRYGDAVVARVPDFPQEMPGTVTGDEATGDTELALRLEVDGALRTVPTEDVKRTEPGYLDFLDGDEQIAQLNVAHFLCGEGGESSVWVLVQREPQDGAADLSHPLVLERMSVRSFRVQYGNVPVRIIEHGKTKVAPLARGWLDSPDRNTFRRFEFDPSRPPSQPGDPGDVFNTWRNFAVQPGDGSCERILSHLLVVMCNGDGELYQYALAWLARMVQHPALPGETALVFYGKEGTGKSIFINMLVRMCVPHSVVVHSARHLVGNFNAHLQHCVLLYADEAFFAGDKQHASVLKGIITERLVMVEQKYSDAAQTENHLHLIMSSNEPHVVPAGPEARRFVVCEVADHFRGDHDYFRDLYAEMDNGGRQAFMRHLMQIALADFQVRAVPDTAGLREQKLRSLSPLLHWAVSVGRLGTLVYSLERPTARPKALA